MNNQDKWIEFAIEIQSIAQAGLVPNGAISSMTCCTADRTDEGNELSGIEF